MKSLHSDVLIIGRGVIGSAAAYSLKAPDKFPFSYQ